MPKLTYLVGLPCSGKSTYASKLAEKTGAEIVSISEIRNKLRFVNKDITENEVFVCMNNEVLKILKNGNDCIVDGTNIKSRTRKHFVTHTIRNIDCEKECIVIATPIDKCKENNTLQGCKLNSDIIDTMYKSWETPAHWEGWDKIWIHYENPEWMTINGKPLRFIVDTIPYDQGSKHHLHSLGMHSMLVKDYVQVFLKNPDLWKRNEKWNKNNLIVAAMLHDCGKPATRVFNDGKVTYYSHHNVGAYESLFFEYDDDIDPVYVSNLINYHMAPVFWDGEKARTRAIHRWGRDFFEDIMILYDADEKGKY